MKAASFKFSVLLAAPFLFLWLERAGCQDLLLLMSNGISGFLPSSAPTLGYMRQRGIGKVPLCCSLGPQFPIWSASFLPPTGVF